MCDDLAAEGSVREYRGQSQSQQNLSRAQVLRRRSLLTSTGPALAGPLFVGQR